MTPGEVYQSREAEFTASADRLQKLSNRLSVARLASFAGGLVLFAVLVSVSVALASALLASSLIGFTLLVFRYETTERSRKRFMHLAEINRLELKCLDGEFSSYRTGNEYTERDHPYSIDLDIFGKASLFQYLCRTTSKPGADLLAEYLRKPAEIKELANRQEAVSELSPLTDWRQELIIQGYLTASAANDPVQLTQWLASNDKFTKITREKITILALSAFTLSLIALVIAGYPVGLLTLALIINFTYYFTRLKRINKLHEQVSQSTDLLKSYSETIRLIEDKKFKASKLDGLQESFKGEHPASESISTLSKLVNRLDSRLNMIMAIPLNAIFFSDIHFCLALEKWKREHAEKIPVWFAAMSEFEVLASLANAAFNNPGWAFPVITGNYFELRAENMGHPLIPESRRICNDITATGSGKSIIITGSNMSGKSTFLRTCGINAVLALAGAPVCASAFTMSYIRLHTSMRISDSLEENISSFYAELRRMREIITAAEKDPNAFLLLDEILRGTNSDDRYSGSVALIRQLTGYGAVTLVATHDLRLAGLENELPGKIENYHFDVKVSGEELYFDYKLTPGICTSFNASLLMKKMGIKV